MFNIKWIQYHLVLQIMFMGHQEKREAVAYRRTLLKLRDPSKGGRRGAPPEFDVDPGWQADRFPAHAVCYRSPKEIAEIYAKVQGGNRNPVTSYPKPADGSLRIVGTGHSFMGPGYKTFPLIVKAAGFQQPPPLTHTGGGITGSARYKWEQENGIFQFDGNPTPKLLASIANAEWDAMMWGLWRDRLGHLGPGFGNLEGYVFYATLYGRSPERIEGDIHFGGSPDYPSRELDRVFREIAWQAVVNNPLSGVTDKDGDGIRD
jgi:hypothetical protein